MTGRAGPLEADLGRRCQEIVGLLDRAVKEPPERLGAEVDEAERRTVEVRDALIRRLREGSDASPRDRSALDAVNAALSLIVGVEYPAGGLNRLFLKQAQDLLARIIPEMP